MHNLIKSNVPANKKHQAWNKPNKIKKIGFSYENTVKLLIKYW